MANYIIFGDADSSDYGITISGEGVFNAPERDIEMIEVPGRNGNYALDKGRFLNTTVKYPAANYESTMSDFTTNLSDFRNALCSQTGYQRLTDSFHTDEYRLGVYKGGLEINPITDNTASEFEIEFDCKPQRFLTDGESATNIESGGTITNPTLFDASPLLLVNGYGDIDVNGTTLTITDSYVGEVELASSKSSSTSSSSANPSVTLTYTFDESQVNSGDTLTLSNISGNWVGRATLIAHSYIIDSMVASVTSDGFTTSTCSAGMRQASIAYIYFYATNETLTAGTSKTITAEYSLAVNTEDSDGTVTASTWGFTYTLVYDGNGTITITFAIDTDDSPIASVSLVVTSTKTIGDSTIGTLGQPLYLDCELGEAYKYEDSTLVSVNSAVSFGSDLPVLSPGSNTITFDSTVTNLDVIPRWWRI